MMMHYFGKTDIAYQEDNQFTGTEKYHSIGNTKILLTDGACHFFKQDQDALFVVFIYINGMLNKYRKQYGEVFASIHIVPKDNGSFAVVIDDGNYLNQVFTEQKNDIGLTKSYYLFAQLVEQEKWVVMLPS